MEGCRDSVWGWYCAPPDDRPRLHIPVNGQKPVSRALARSRATGMQGCQRAKHGIGIASSPATRQPSRPAPRRGRPVCFAAAPVTASPGTVIRRPDKATISRVRAPSSVYVWSFRPGSRTVFATGQAVERFPLEERFRVLIGSPARFQRRAQNGSLVFRSRSCQNQIRGAPAGLAAY